MQHEAWFFIGLFVFIFVIWIAAGGPSRGISLNGPSLPLASGTSTRSGGTSFGLPQALFSIGSSHTELKPLAASLPGPGTGSSAGSPLSLSGVGYGTPSPYQGLVSMSHSVSGAGDPAQESVEISASEQSTVAADLTGWTLESEATGAASVIPKGTEVPASGIVNAAQDIILLPGERAVVVSGRSPIGASFKENLCIGYFGQFQHFSPSLPDNCPAPDSELETRYQGSYIRDAACIDYVHTVSRCQAVLSPPVSVSGACQSFIVKYLNYNGCVAAHQGDADFAGDTWRIYLGRTAPLFRASHEVVKLLDAQGKTVDAFAY